jgi:hypothetical protein
MVCRSHEFGFYDADDRTPFRRRWGGGASPASMAISAYRQCLRHEDTEKREAVVSDSTLHRMAMEKPFDPHDYPSSSSDIAALMVFQHQGRMANLITRVGWEARMSADGGRTDFAAGPLHDAVNELVDYLFFVDEETLPSPIKGTSGFAEIFSRQGPRDQRGRSLRALDLEHRLLKYPCSYMIYSAAFRALPADVRAAIYARMWFVLSGKDGGPRYARLSPEDRRAVIEILRDTLPDLTGEFTTGKAEYQGEVLQ